MVTYLPKKGRFWTAQIVHKHLGIGKRSACFVTWMLTDTVKQIGQNVLQQDSSCLFGQFASLEGQYYWNSYNLSILNGIYYLYTYSFKSFIFKSRETYKVFLILNSILVYLPIELQISHQKQKLENVKWTLN